MRLSTTKREQLYDAECAKSQAAGLGSLPICTLCGFPIDGVRQPWDESHDKHKPKWLGGLVEGIAHRACNRDWNHRHDTPLFHKSNRVRQRYIGAHRPRTFIPGSKGHWAQQKKKINGTVIKRSR